MQVTSLLVIQSLGEGTYWPKVRIGIIATLRSTSFKILLIFSVVFWMYGSDVNLVKVGNSRFNLDFTQIHKKPTPTNLYLPYTSHNPKHQQLAITHFLHNRISSHITERQIAWRKVCQTLRTNEYPCKCNYPPKPRLQRELPTFTSLPYIQKTTEKIRRILNEVDLKVATTPIRTFGQYVPSPKDSITNEEVTCIVYEVPCTRYDFVYVG